MRLLGETVLTVHLVRNEEKIVSAAKFSDGLEFFPAVQSSARVARIGYQDSLRGRGYHLLHLLDGRKGESFPDVGMDSLERNPVKVGKGVVVGIKRFEHENLVPLVAGYLHCYRKVLASRHLDQYVLEFYVNADFFVILVDEPLPEFQKTG